MLDLFGPIAPATRPARATFKAHARPTGGMYFGADREPVGAGRLVNLRTAGARVQVLDATTGEHLADLSASVRFWIAPAVEVAVEDIERARIDAAHLEAAVHDYMHWSSSGRSADATIALVWSSLRCDYFRAAQAGRGALALALAERLAELQPAHDADQAERARAMAEQKARIIAERAAEAAPDEVVIVPCGGKKLPTAAPAGELYVGSYHRACRRAAAARGGRLLILSAKYGLLDPATVIDPYDLTMGQPGSVTVATVRGQAALLGILDARVTVLAGKKYADVVTAIWPDADRPLNGTRGMFQQMGALKEIATMPKPRPRTVPKRPARAHRLLAEMTGQLELFAA
ncbi:DUF6884 domain-containing protein [Micromonospora sp. NPDC049230]|uniref:DUF6884 domain-containing protein n=1 Tax=Micromonospora sp. NPDC049230 TaxID=3155502 RepID=UPI0033E9F39D